MSDLVFARWGMTMRTPAGPVDLVPLQRRLDGDKGATVLDDERPAAVLALTYLGTPIHQITKAMNMAHRDVRSALLKYGMEPVCVSDEISWTGVAYSTTNAGRRTRRRAERVDVGGRLVHPSAEVPHGTETGYTEWSCHCAPCTTAHAAKLAAYRARKAVAA